MEGVLPGPLAHGLRVALVVTVARPIPAYYYKNYYKNACSECMPAIPIVIPI